MKIKYLKHFFFKAKEITKTTFSHVAILNGFVSLKCEKYLDYKIDQEPFRNFLLNQLIFLSSYGDFKYNIFKTWKALFTKMKSYSFNNECLKNMSKVLRGNFDCPIDGVSQFSFEILDVSILKAFMHEIKCVFL